MEEHLRPVPPERERVTVDQPRQAAPRVKEIRLRQVEMLDKADHLPRLVCLVNKAPGRLAEHLDMKDQLRQVDSRQVKVQSQLQAL